MRKWTVHRQLLQVLTSWNPKRRLRPALGLDWFRLALRAIFEEQDQHEQNLRKRSSFTENRIHPSPTWYVCRCQRPVISLQKKRRGRWVGRLGGVELFKGFPPKMYPTDIPIPGGFLFLLYLFFSHFWVWRCQFSFQMALLFWSPNFTFPHEQKLPYPPPSCVLYGSNFSVQNTTGVCYISSASHFWEKDLNFEMIIMNEMLYVFIFIF